MNTLVVGRFGDPGSAERAVPRLRLLSEEGRLVVDDAALVSWPRTARKPSTETLGGLTGPGELWGGSWGVLLGLIFLVPIAGPAFGAAAGAFAGTLAEFGVDDDFVLRVRAVVTPGTSALFVLSGAAEADRFVAAISDDEAQIVRWTFAREHEQRLLATFGEESRRPA